MISVLDDKEKCIRFEPVESSTVNRNIISSYWEIICFQLILIKSSCCWVCCKHIYAGYVKPIKVNIPVWSILSMTGSVQHKVVKWLVELLQPIHDMYQIYCIKDSFTFVNSITNCPFSSQDKFMCLVDISNLLSSVSLQETIDRCAEALYHSHLPLSSTNYILETVSSELIKFTTMTMEFSFNNIMHRQIGVGDNYGPTMPNIFFYCEPTQL